MENNIIKSIGVLCSGGDSPGMNCAIRAVVRTALDHNLKVFGIYRGYAGILEREIIEMNASSVGNIIQRGGTILKTSRFPDFHKPEIRKKAYYILKEEKIDSLVIIGGNGSFNGAYALHSEHKIPIAGIPGTIDNDIKGSDYSIGFDTAVQTAVEAVDKIRDTAYSHDRTFIVEVMGRKSPSIALQVGMCTGAENIVFPTKKESLNTKQISLDILRGLKRGKKSSIIIAAEGEIEGIGHKIKAELLNEHNIKSHVCILGHIQRGGSPTAYDRFIASQMGHLSIKSLIENQRATVSALRLGKIVSVPFQECLQKRFNVAPKMMEILKSLSI